MREITLTRDIYLYLYKNKNMDFQLAIARISKTRGKERSFEHIHRLRSGFKLIVDGSEIDETSWAKVLKTLRRMLLQHFPVETESIAVNSEGKILVIKEEGIYKLDLMFDWSCYDVCIAKMLQKMDIFKQHVKKMEKKVKLLEQDADDRNLQIIKSRSYDFPPVKFKERNLIKPGGWGFVARTETAVPIIKFTPLDVNVKGRTPITPIDVFASTGSFSRDDWFFVGVEKDSTNKEKKPASMVVGFYNGQWDEVTVKGKKVYIPFNSSATVRATTEFFVAKINGLGLRFMFIF